MFTTNHTPEFVYVVFLEGPTYSIIKGSYLNIDGAVARMASVRIEDGVDEDEYLTIEQYKLGEAVNRY